MRLRILPKEVGNKTGHCSGENKGRRNNEGKQGLGNIWARCGVLDTVLEIVCRTRHFTNKHKHCPPFTSMSVV